MTNELLREISDASIFGDLVFFTGAGVSLDLKQASDPAKNLPSWHVLLISLTERLNSKITPYDLDDLRSLLLLDKWLLPVGHSAPTGEMLIQAAEILARTQDVRPAVADLTRSVANSPGQRHIDMEGLTPAGYVTFNYDKGHEYAGRRHLEVVRSDDPTGLVALVKNGFEKPFIVKAHGCVDKPDSIVLTASSYKELLYRNDAYRALLSFIFNRFLIVTIGFGLSDPDFDALLGEFERTFGTVPRQPIVITKIPADKIEEGKRTALRRRFGIRFLNVSNYDEIPALFKTVESEAGARVEGLLEMCISPTRTVRHHAHRLLERLSEHGRHVLKRWIIVRVHTILISPPERESIFALSELLYSLKVLGALSRSEAAVVRGVVDNYAHYDPPAIALITLQTYYPLDSERDEYERWLASLDARINQLSNMPDTFGFINFPERHRAYLVTLRTYLLAKSSKDLPVSRV